MVVGIQSTLELIIVIFAFLAAFFGLWVINALFRNKLKDLFSDTQFFIFFFLVFGYSLYALGEVTWFLIFNLFEIYSVGSMPDIYWVTGMVLMVVSLLVLNGRLYARYGTGRSSIALLLFGAVLLFGVLFYVSVVGGGLLEYYYAAMSTLLVVASAPLFIFYRSLRDAGAFEAKLVYLFFGNMCFLATEFIYVYTVPREIYGMLGALADSLYALGYFLSALAFITLLLKFSSSAKKQVMG